MSIRSERVAAELVRALMEVIPDVPVAFSDGLITVTRALVAPDLKSARVYISILGGKTPHERTIDRMKKAAPQLRHALSRTLSLKYLPELFFYLDDTLDEIEHIESLFRELHDNEHKPGEVPGGDEK